MIVKTLKMDQTTDKHTDGLAAQKIEAASSQQPWFVVPNPCCYQPKSLTSYNKRWPKPHFGPPATNSTKRSSLITHLVVNGEARYKEDKS